MSLLALSIATILIAAAALCGLRKRYWIAAALVLLAVAPLTVDATTAKALFVWLGLIGPVFMLVVMMRGSLVRPTKTQRHH